jgi:Radical SAM superfamily
MLLGLTIGARCNASCGHCAKAYGPTRTEVLAKERILRLMDEAAAIDDGEPLCFAITGGEPFLHFETLVEIVTHGAEVGGEISCVTNAYWARSSELARAKLAILADCGLTALAVSVSRFHQRYIPLERARLALETAREFGIFTTLKGAVMNSDLVEGGVLAKWKTCLDADEVKIFPVLAYLREGEIFPEDEYYREPGLPEQTCPNEILSIDFDGVARSCCSPGPADEFLAVGHIHATALEEVHRRFIESGKQRILREIGPIAFAREAIAAGLGARLRDAYAGPCDLCLHIRTDPELKRIANEVAAARRQGG